MVDLRSGVAFTGLGAEARPIVPPARDIRFAGLLIPLVFFSSPEVPVLLLSSIEASDSRGLWAPVAAGVPVVGFLVTVVAVVGRAGGLLRVLPVEDRALAVLVGFIKEEAFEGVVFVPVNGRFGGIPALVAG